MTRASGSHPVAIDVDQTYDKAYHSRYEACTVHKTCWCLLFILVFRVNSCSWLVYDLSRLVTSERSHPGAIDVDKTV